MNSSSVFLLCGSALAGTSVMLGAFAAHALKRSLSPELLNAFQTGVQYQMTHALALLFIGLLLPRIPDNLTTTAGYLILLGTLLFSGSLYILALTSIRWVGPVTPLGGLALIIGWLLLFVSIIRHTSAS